MLSSNDIMEKIIAVEIMGGEMNGQRFGGMI